ncbi:MAG: PEGA domain-containing protein [Gemmatimonadota bacterium]|nr:PEGA domain-containing protein [Gemmatimonadota bacterium]
MPNLITFITLTCLLTAEFAASWPNPVHAQTRTRQLMIISKPSGASVYVDNRLMGFTPYSGRFAAGKYQVRVSLDEYKDWRQAVQLQGDRRFVITLPRGAQPQRRAWLWTLLGFVVAGGAAIGAYTIIRNRVDSSGGNTVELTETPSDPP